MIREELINEALPFDFGFEWGIEESPERIYMGIELPPTPTATDIIALDKIIQALNRRSEIASASMFTHLDPLDRRDPI